VKRASSHGDIFLKQRLKAPPKETWEIYRHDSFELTYYFEYIYNSTTTWLM
jgi:hypothetical protein